MESTKIASEDNQGIWHIASVVLGGLSIWPYPIVWVTNALHFDSLPSPFWGLLGIVLLFIAPCNGVPFGLTGILSGSVGLIRLASSNKKPLVTALAIFGILLSIAGCVSNIYFFSNMEPWNSVPQQ